MKMLVDLSWHAPPDSAVGVRMERTDLILSGALMVAPAYRHFSRTLEGGTESEETVGIVNLHWAAVRDQR